jgi:1,4-alpha-glucan branching enzyme
VIVYRRKGKDPKEDILVILNLTPVVRRNWKVYANGKAEWKEIFNTDLSTYWGTGDVYNPSIQTTLVDEVEDRYEVNIHLPALGAVLLK